jgi:2-phospho-L-lactate guanylyltransferase
MTVWAIIPAKPATEGKSRLTGSLPPDVRARLNLNLFRHTLSIAGSVFAPANIIVISRDPAFLGLAHAAGARAVAEHGYELNQALHQAALIPPANDAVLTISTDLPNLAAADLHAMLLGRTAIAIAPDRAEQGTNALLTSPAAIIPYQFGEGSFARHRDSAGLAGKVPRIVSRPGLAFDLDTPEDLLLCPETLFT